MLWPSITHLPLLVAAGAIAIWVSVVAFSRPNVPGGRVFGWLNLAIAHWCLSSAFHALDQTLDSRILWAQVQYIGIVAIPIYARVMRASVLSVRERDFVTASRALGESPTGILVRRIMPNAITPLVVQGTLGIGGAILEVAALSFIGLGAQPPLAEWGSMIAIDRTMMTVAPHLIIFPGIAITLTVLGFNLLGDGLRDALDPRLNR